MVLSTIRSFEKKESELFKLFNKIRDSEFFETHELLKDFYEKLSRFKKPPEDKLEETLYRQFNSAYIDADKSLQRIYIYQKTGEPLALIYSNVFHEQFLEKRAKLLVTVEKTKNLLNEHLKEGKNVEKARRQ